MNGDDVICILTFFYYGSLGGIPKATAPMAQWLREYEIKSRKHQYYITRINVTAFCYNNGLV